MFLRAATRASSVRRLCGVAAAAVLYRSYSEKENAYCWKAEQDWPFDTEVLRCVLSFSQYL